MVTLNFLSGEDLTDKKTLSYDMSAGKDNNLVDNDFTKKPVQSDNMPLNSYKPTNDVVTQLATLLNQHRLERGLGALTVDEEKLRPFWVFAHQRAHEVHLSNQDAASGDGLVAEMHYLGFRFRAAQELRVAGVSSAEDALQQIVRDERLEGQLLGQSAGAVAVGYCKEASTFSVLLFEPVNTAQARVTRDGSPLALTEVRVNGTAYLTDGDGYFEVAQALPYGEYAVTAGCAAAGVLAVNGASHSQPQELKAGSTPELAVHVVL